MKSRQSSIYFWGFPWFFLSVSLILLILGIRTYFDLANNPKSISREFQKEMDFMESETKSRLEFFSSDFVSNPLKNSRPKIEFRENKNRDDDISLFVIKGDSLVYWNNNNVILPADFFKVHNGGSFASRIKNGWYGFHCLQKGPYRFLGSYLIKNEFSFQNDFIKNQFSSGFDFPASLSIEEKKGKYPIYTRDKRYLFSLDFDKAGTTNDSRTGVIFFLFILGLLSFYYFIFTAFSKITWFRNRDNLLVICFGSTLVVLRIIQSFIGFPAEIYRSELFSPAWYSSSALLPSLGEFTLDALTWIVISLVIYKKSSTGPAGKLVRQSQRFIGNTILLFLLLVFFQAAGFFIGDLVLNSSFSLNLQNIFGLTAESGFALFIISALLFSAWLISAKFFERIPDTRSQRRWLVLPAIIAASFYSLVCWCTGWNINLTVTLFFLVFLAWFRYFRSRKKSLFSLPNLLFFLCFYAIFTTILLNRANQVKETGKLNLLAGKLITQRNPVTEILYEQVERRLHEDSLLNQWIEDGSGGNGRLQDSIGSYLVSRYFRDYWKKYQIQVTACEPAKELKIQPQGYLVNCDTYFHGIIGKYGKATIIPNLFFLDYGFGKEYYLAIFSGKPFEPDPGAQPAIFIEFNLKNSGPDPGYPGLLMDKTRMDLPNLSDYSYALFQNGRLIRAVGPNSFKMDLGQYRSFSSAKPFFTEAQVAYFQYRINDADALLISKKEETFLSSVSPFSYLFILFSIITIFVAGLVNFPNNRRIFPSTLRNRLHFSLIGILVVTMLAIGILLAIKIIQINSKKNVDNLRERASSVVVEIQHKFSPLQDMDEVSKGEMEDFLIKLSNVFFTDINIYSDRGLLISSSRPQIFEEGLLSERMNASACQKLIVEKNSVFIHQESIGSMQFNSAYLPFYNDHDQLLGFVNLPCFAKQDESKKEISSFLVTFLNIYILIILFGVFVTVLISNYITAPLALLAGKLSQLRFGMVNEKIVWKQDDEIGQLVAQYNRMVDELGRSAQLLARSERESAWREMARQVAHEIKNPLTPMKLNAQYLEKAWKEKAPDWDLRLARFTKTLVEQIDALSVIASDFSDFAKMQTVEMRQVDLAEVIGFVLSLYQDTTRIHYEFISEVSEPFVFGDRSQLIRVFTNLVNNAVQAIGDARDGMIRIRVVREGDHLVVEVSDNGCGIPANRTEKIFQPDFTTKTSGMGLGLAIVKGIVQGMKGEISFTSGEQKGTKFIIKFQTNGENADNGTK